MSNNPQHESGAQPPCFGYAPQYPEDEIDLFDIWRVLVRQRKLIVSVTLLVSLLAVGYALFLPRVYKAEVFLLPPLEKDVAGLNIPEIRDSRKDDSKDASRRITVEMVYTEMLLNLQSFALRRQFFDEQQLAEKIASDSSGPLEDEKIFTEGFHKLLSIKKGENDTADFCMVSLEGGKPSLIRVWLNNFVVMVDDYTVNQFVEAMTVEIVNKKQALKAKIEGLRQMVASRRLDRITQLQEQIYIAKKLGIVRQDGGGTFSSSDQNSLGMGLGRNDTEILLYLRGTVALQAEIDVLQKRKDDDPFIVDLRHFQEELVSLEKIELNRDDFKAVRFDRLAVLPDVPIKPKRKLIVVYGTILGLMLGLFAAFLVNFMTINRDKIFGLSKDFSERKSRAI